MITSRTRLVLPLSTTVDASSGLAGAVGTGGFPGQLGSPPASAPTAGRESSGDNLITDSNSGGNGGPGASGGSGGDGAAGGSGGAGGGGAGGSILLQASIIEVNDLVGAFAGSALGGMSGDGATRGDDGRIIIIANNDVAPLPITAFGRLFTRVGAAAGTLAVNPLTQVASPILPDLAGPPASSGVVPAGTPPFQADEIDAAVADDAPEAAAWLAAIPSDFPGFDLVAVGNRGMVPLMDVRLEITGQPGMLMADALVPGATLLTTLPAGMVSASGGRVEYVSGAETIVTDLPSGVALPFAFSVDAVIPPCPGDFNGDGILSAADQQNVVARLSAADPTADFDGNGSTDFFDLIAALALFDAGCP